MIIIYGVIRCFFQKKQVGTKSPPKLNSNTSIVYTIPLNAYIHPCWGIKGPKKKHTQFLSGP